MQATVMIATNRHHVSRLQTPQNLVKGMQAFDRSPGLLYISSVEVEFGKTGLIGYAGLIQQDGSRADNDNYKNNAKGSNAARKGRYGGVYTDT